MVDELRRVVVESLLPYLTQNSSKIESNVKRMALSMKKKQTEQKIDKLTNTDSNKSVIKS